MTIMPHPVGIIMAPAIYFDGQPGFIAIEVQNVGTNRMLPAKSDAEPATANSLPQQNLGERHSPPEVSRTLNGELRGVHSGR
jgi:hypothetical protein